MESELLTTILADEWITFPVSKLLHTNVAWMNKMYQEVDGVHFNQNRHKDFLYKFSYGISSNPSFKFMEFDEGDTKLLLAERYGGFGLAYNGGGVRTGTIDKYQVKGIGANCLVANNNDYAHSYGGQDAHSAITEIIFTHIYSKILPLGAVKIHGLIFTGKTTAYDTSIHKPCWGVIMVREACLRPAHLMATMEFRPHPDHKHKFINDVARTRNVHKKIASSIESHSEFIVFLSKFLGNCANQFAFARVARVLHGALSPSNISIDGAWLDLNLTGFINGGVNQSATSAFYSEATDVLNYATEILYTYSKYNDVYLNPAPLINYYNELFVSYCRYHLEYLVALTASNIISSAEYEWNKVADSLLCVINSGKKVISSVCKPRLNDPVVEVIEILFLSLVDTNSIFARFTKYVNFFEDVEEITRSFRVIYERAYFYNEIDAGSFKIYVIYSAIVALKRSILSGYFFSSNVYDNVWRLCSSDKPENISEFIESHCFIADWIFEKKSKSPAVLFSNTDIKISYMQDGRYQVYQKKDALLQSLYFDNYAGLMTYIDHSIPQDIFLVNGFDFKVFLNKLNDFLSKLESLV